MTPAKAKTATARLDELTAAVADAKHRQRLAEAAVQTAEHQVQQLTDRVADSYATGDDKAAQDARAERDQLNAEQLVDLRDRAEGARRATQAAEVERGTYALENSGELWREHDRQARAVTGDIEAWVGQAKELKRRYWQETADTQALQRLTGRQRDGLHQLPHGIREALDLADRARGVPVPAPGAGVQVPV